jgi:hypothetical protein
VTIVAIKILAAEMVDIMKTFPEVRGREAMEHATNPTTPKTMVQVPWSVMVLNVTVKVRMWLAIRKIMNSSWPK